MAVTRSVCLAEDLVRERGGGGGDAACKWSVHRAKFLNLLQKYFKFFAILPEMRTDYFFCLSPVLRWRNFLSRFYGILSNDVSSRLPEIFINTSFLMFQSGNKFEDADL